MYRIYFISLLLFFHSTLQAQDKHTYRIDVFLPGISYEYRFAENIVWLNRIGFTVLSENMFQKTEENKSSYLFSIYPEFSTQLNYFYNTDRRIKYWKSVEMNSGNYFCIGVAYAKSINWNITNLNTEEQITNVTKYIYSGWGLIRNYNQFRYMNLLLGVRYNLDSKGFTPHIQLRYGFTIFSKQKEIFYQKFH